MDKKEQKEWFADWFDSPFYHILYKFRDHAEAQFLIDNLVAYLDIAPQERVLDLACGKGRHSIYLHKKGLNVTGMDLSPQSIAAAQKHATANLQFKVHDMREALPEHTFDVIFNLFTSFGYFEDDADSLKTLSSIKNGLHVNGTFVLDFLNTRKLLRSLIAEEEKTVEGITFLLTRTVEGGFIKKRIRFTHEGQAYDFEEKVRAFTYDDFKKAFNATGLQIITTFGDYALNAYDGEASDRLILVAKPK